LESDAHRIIGVSDLTVITASTRHDGAWDTFYRRLRRCTPPQRPPADMDTIVRDVIGPQTDTVLALGATPELATVAQSVVAVDWSATAISFMWPRSAAGRSGIRGNWLQLPFTRAAVSATVGDGCLNCLEYPDDYRLLFNEVTRVVRPGGRVALRTFITPDACEPLDATRALALAGGVHSVSALKWRLANGLCAERLSPNLEVRAISEAFDQLFPDRGELSRVTHWSDEEMAGFDALGRVPGTYSFPTVHEVLSLAPASFMPGFVSSGRYELSERCPLLVMTVPE
jgi:SAM-dependent methyltransferase